MQNLYYGSYTTSRSYYDACDVYWSSGGSSSSDNLTPEQKKIRMGIAIAVPVAIFAVIMVCTACSCICCRPRNQDILDQQNTRIDPLAQIDINKIKHWTYIRNNIPGSISNKTAADGMFIQPAPVMMQQQPVMGMPVQQQQPMMPGMMGPPGYQ